MLQNCSGLLRDLKVTNDNKAYYWTFHVVGIEPLEQNIYHIDVQFSDPEQHWKEYRVRGYRTNSQWTLVE